MSDPRKLSIIALTFLANLPIVFSQEAASILPSAPSSDFPSCASSCPDLNGAASFCLQSNRGESQEVVNSCFCQREEVTPFYESPSGVCDTSCPTESDRSTLQTWFTTYCAATGVAPNDGVRTTLITSTRAPTSTATGTQRGSQSSSSQADGWFASHWQWVVMLIVLAIGLGALAFLIRCLKRRHTRKTEQRRAALAGPPGTGTGSSPDIGRDMWGPHQHMAHTGGWEYANEQDGEMRQASAPSDGGTIGNAIGKAKNFRKDRNRKLGKHTRHNSQRSSRQADTTADGVKDIDWYSRNNTATTSASRRAERAERRREGRDDQEPEAATSKYDEKAGKERQRTSREGGPGPAMTEISQH